MSKEDNKRSNILRELEKLAAAITGASERISLLLGELNIPYSKPNGLTVFANTTLVEDWHTCDYCYEMFDWGNDEMHYADDAGNDVCPECSGREVKRTRTAVEEYTTARRELQTKLDKITVMLEQAGSNK